MNRFSSRWIDLSEFKTKAILMMEVGQQAPDLVRANNAGTVWKCRCPIHNENTASMKLYCSKRTGFYVFKCLGCGHAGDVFAFLMQVHNWEFWTAMKYIFKKYRRTSSRAQLAFSFLKDVAVVIPKTVPPTFDFKIPQVTASQLRLEFPSYFEDEGDDLPF